MSDEVLSGLKVLVALAKADGVVHDNERLAIESALDGVLLPEQTTVEALLAGDVDLDAELALIKSDEVKQQTFDSACALAYVDGEASDVEKAFLEKVRAAFSLDAQAEASSERVKQALERAFAPLASGEGDSFSKRDVAIDEEIQRFAIFSAALSSFTLPAFCDWVEKWNDVHLARKIGSFYARGATNNAQYWKTFVDNVVGSSGSWFAVSLLARLTPISSRIASAFASTYALGVITKMYFEKSESVETEALRAAFKKAKADGLNLAKDAKAKIDEKRQQIEKSKSALDADLATKKINETEYATQLVTLD